MKPLVWASAKRPRMAGAQRRWKGKTWGGGGGGQAERKKRECVLVSCSKQQHKLGGLQATEMYCLTVPETTSLKSRCRQGRTPFGALGRIHFLPLPALVAAGIPWLVATSL